MNREGKEESSCSFWTAAASQVSSVKRMEKTHIEYLETQSWIKFSIYMCMYVIGNDSFNEKLKGLNGNENQ